MTHKYPRKCVTRRLTTELMWMETLEGGTNENKLFMCAINPQLKLHAATLKDQ